MLDFLNGQRKRKRKSSYYAHARGPCSGSAGDTAAQAAKTAQKTDQPAAWGTAAKMRKNSQVLRSDKTAKTPEDLAAFIGSGTAQTSAHNEIICGMLCFFGRRSACLAAFTASGTAAPARPAWAAPRQGGYFSHRLFWAVSA